MLEEESRAAMPLNRTVLRVGAAIVVIAAIGVGLSVAVDAQQSPLSLQPSGPNEAPPRPARPKPRPKPEAQTQPNHPSTSQASEPATQQPNQAAAQAQPETVFDEHARQGNIKTCAKVFGVLGRLLAADSTFTAQTQWESASGDSHSVQSIVALNGGSGNPTQQAAGVVFAAPIGQTCEGTLVRVTPTNSNCQAVAADLGKMNGKGASLGNLGVINMENGTQVMLVPFGNACIAVSTLRASGQG
ncbi:hypothetical protein ACFQU1_22400 [Chelatococcus sp. GCM10030263]|uniref:hypothetical protein n=1 Tax=Chelatococcus sp. GCM10030263 TaxID=3273387 RepID=UPI003613B833